MTCNGGGRSPRSAADSRKGRRSGLALREGRLRKAETGRRWENGSGTAEGRRQGAVPTEQWQFQGVLRSAMAYLHSAASKDLQSPIYDWLTEGGSSAGG